MARKPKLWKDIRLTFRHSRGRFVSLVGLLALGAFALAGFKVAGPDMRATAEHYLAGYHMADLQVIGSMGIDADDEAQIGQAAGLADVEYGYLKDVTVAGTHDAVRVWSAPERLSEFELVEGRLPEAEDEVALDRDLAQSHPVGSTIEFNEKTAADGSTTLTRHSFTVVGMVNSMEIISEVNRGQTQAGTGDLAGYAVAAPEVFDVDYHMVARLSFEDTQGLDPFGDDYLARVAQHKDELEELLAGQPANRLATIRAQYQESIDEGQAKVDDARAELADARATLDDAATQIADAHAKIADSEGELDDAATQLADGRTQLDASAGQLAEARTVLDASDAQLAAARAQLESAAAQLADGRAQLAEKEAAYQAGVEQLEARRAQAEQQAADATAELDARQAQLDALTAAGQPVPEGAQEAIDAARAELARQTQAAQEQLSAAQAQLDDAAAQIKAAHATLDARQSEYDEGRAAFEAGSSEYSQGLATYEAGLAAWQEAADTLAAKTGEYNEAAGLIASAKEELAAKEREYDEGLADYDEALPDAEAQIAEGEADLTDARATLAELEEPAYKVYNRREAPGSEGYVTYDSVSEIVDSLANIFPYFLYLVAALVASTTMTRMVDEERIGAGTLKALGYDDADVIKKFVVYGASAAVLGTLIGVVLGHTLLPYIVYSAYAARFTLPPIELHANTGVSLACLALALAVTVGPAWAVARRELAEKPAQLLLPKPPAAGSKVLLERVPFVWRRLSFMRKVTVRNLFRYKARAAMTVVGVAGAVCLMFTGFAVRHSVSGIASEQFGSIIGYDLIVAENAHVSAEEQAAIDDLLASPDVSAHAAVTYEALTKVAGSKGDAQEIALLAPADATGWQDYLNLRDRATGETIDLPAHGAVISERLADLAGVRVGDTMSFKDADGVERSVEVAGVCEMYMNHFMFMSTDAYEEVFGKDAEVNAYVATLADDSLEHTQEVAAQFMDLAGVMGVVQSTTLVNMVSVIVGSLNKVMGILIGLATMLAIVIVYNLVTINVSERIRELSTVKVLGFFDGEVSMYIYRETILLSALAVPVGWGLGRLLQLYIIRAVPPETVMFNPAPGALAFVVSAAVVAVVVAGMYLVVKRRLRKVDMLEALKSVD